MANINAPRGLVPVRNADNARYIAGARKYYIPASYGTALYVGDPVIKVTSSTNTAVVRSGCEEHAIGTLNGINKATAGSTNVITGVIVGFEASPTQRTILHNPASTERVALVMDDPRALFAIQSDGNLAATAVGKNSNITTTTAGSIYTGMSGVQLDHSAAAADTTMQLTIVGLSKENRRDDTSGTPNYLEFVVRINLHSEGASVGAAGI